MNDTPPPLDPAPTNRPAYVAPPASSGSGKKTAACCGFGCLGLIVISIVGVILAVGWGKKALTNLAVNATADASAEVAVVPADLATTEAAKKKLDAFMASMNGGGQVSPLELNEAEVNALIQNHPNFSAMSDNTVVTIEEDILTAKTSLPLDVILKPFPEVPEVLKGRYFNGSVSLAADTVGGKPAIFVRDISTQGGSLPSWLVDAMRQQDLLKNVESDSEMKKLFGKIEELKIEGGRIVIVPRP